MDGRDNDVDSKGWCYQECRIMTLMTIRTLLQYPPKKSAITVVKMISVVHGIAAQTIIKAVTIFFVDFFTSIYICHLYLSPLL